MRPTRGTAGTIDATTCIHYVSILTDTGGENIESQLRPERGAKSEKDLLQAAVLLAVLGEKHPGAIEEGRKQVPASILSRLNQAIGQIQSLLERDHPRAWDELH